MRAGNCIEEAAVTRALRSGAMSAALAEHAATCKACGSIAQSAAWMQALAAETQDAAALPDAGLVYWRAQLSQREAEAERAFDVLDGAEVVLGVGAIGAAGWFLWPSLTVGEAWLASSVGAAVLSVVGCLGLVALAAAYVEFADE
jgi:hypothetical protein